MFASRVTNTVDVKDGDKTIAVTIRKIAWRGLKEAAEARQTEAMTTAAKVGADLVRVFRESDAADKGKATPSPEQKETNDREAVYASYDRATILRKGIVSWTSEVKLPDGIDDLDEPTADSLHRAIVDLSVPAPAVAEKKRGEGD